MKGDKEFLEKYHNLIFDIENRPLIFENLKQGDVFWYLRYSYRGNGKKTSKFSIAQYSVHHLDEYHKKVENEKELIPEYYAIYSIRTFQTMTTFSTNPSAEIGKWRTVTEPDHIVTIYEDEMKSDIVKQDDTLLCYYTVVAFDKQKALKAMKEYVQHKATVEKNRFAKFIEEEMNKDAELQEEYDNILKEIENG